MRLTVFNYGSTELAEDQIFLNGNPKVFRPIALLFFLIEVDNRKILVDTGCDTMPGFPLFTHIKPVELLEKYGLKPEGMTDVVLTHAHHDHSDGLRYYPQARLFIHPAEWSRLKLSRPGELVPVEDECLIAPGVRMKVIGGHSRGSAVVLVDGGEKTWLLCGDECYDRENLSKQIPTGASCCQEKSRRFIEEYGRGIYEPIIFHDLNLISSIGSRVLLEVE